MFAWYEGTLGADVTPKDVDADQPSAQHDSQSPGLTQPIHRLAYWLKNPTPNSRLQLSQPPSPQL